MTENEADIPEVENSETLQLDEPEQDWLDDLQVSLNYLTKFSVPGGLVLSNPSIPKASRFFPVIGILIGIVSSLVIAAASLQDCHKELLLLLVFAQFLPSLA